MTLIKSDRQFGVEVEFIAPNNAQYRRIQRQINVVFDGSLRPYQWAGEWVSEPLTGEKGAHTVEHACSVLKKHRADVENPKTSFHVHIDGRKGDGELIEDTKRDPDADVQIGISRAVMKRLTAGEILNICKGRGSLFFSDINIQTIDNVTYFSKGKLSRHPRMNYKYFTFKEYDRSKWLRNVFYFYTMYTEVLQAMVSNSRKINNMYCIPLSDSFDLEDIEKCKTMDDIIDVWYKGYGIGGHYDDSRYHNVNLHSFFDRHGTVEIRSHGATLDPNKILLWVRLHQYIADKLEDMEIDDIKSDKDPFVSFLEFLADDPMLQDYYKRLIGYFSGVIINGEEVIRE